MSDLTGGNDLILHASLRDELSGPVREVRREIQRTARAVDGEFGQATRRTNRDLGQLHNGLLGMSRSLGGTFARGIRTGVTALGALTAAAGYFGLKSASQFQTSQIAFETLLGSAEKGQKLFGELQQINLKTPFGLEAVTQSAQKLLSYGVPLDKLTGSLTGLVDVASLTGQGEEGLSRLSLALGQVVSTGRLTGQEARQFAEAGINAYAIYAEKLGVTQAEVRKLGEAGELSSDILVNALINMDGQLSKFAGGAEKANKTLFGQLSNFKDQLAVRLADSADPLVDELTRTMPQIVGLVGGFVDEIGPPMFGLLGDLADGAARLLPIVGPPLEALFSGVGRLIDAAEPGMQALVPLGNAITASIGGLVDELVPVMPDLVDLFIALVGVAPEFIGMLAEMVPLIGPIARLATALLRFGPADDVLAALLWTLLGYRAVAGIAGGIQAFAAAIGFAGTQAQTAGLQAQTAQGRFAGLGRTAGLIGAGAGVIGTGAMALDQARTPGHSVGQDLTVIGSAAATGAVIGSIVPGLGTGVGALAGGAVGTGWTLADRLFGDVPMAPAAAAGHAAALGMGGGSGLHVTSGMRRYGLRGADSKHLTGHAIDVAGSGLAGYARSVNALGGRAKLEGGHVHAEFGDTPMAPRAGGGPSGGRLAGAQFVFTGNIYGISDLHAAVRTAVRRIESEDDERARRPLRSHTPWRS